MKQSSPSQFDVAIIGGGSAGLFAAIAAARNGASVVLIEKNTQLGKKLSITGGGRCNILHNLENTRDLLSNYTDSDKFLFSAFSVFGVQETIDLFEELGITVETQAGNRAFPSTEKAQDVVNALVKEVKKLSVIVMTKTTVTGLSVGSNKWTIETDGGTLLTKTVILATGGFSHPETGSTGDGFGWLEKLSHTVAQPNPSITPLSVTEKWLSLASGTTLLDGRITFMLDGKSSFRVQGNILFTHFGISGPVILNNAYKVADLLKQGSVTARIECYPGMMDQAIDEKIVAVFDDNRSKQLKNVIKFICPPGMSALLTSQLLNEINLEIKTSEVSRLQRLAIIKKLQNVVITIDGLMGFERAVVADGGVPLTEIDTRTFQSQKNDRLYIIGDLLHINRPSGGFSLQLCWTTGYIAGKHAAEQSTKPL